MINIMNYIKNMALLANKKTMKKLMLFIAILLTVTVNAQMIAPDKQKHLIAGTLIGSSVTYFTLENSHSFAKSMRQGIIFSTAAGIGKETYDVLFCESTFDVKDLGATMIGGFIGSVLTAFVAWDENYPYRYRTIIRMNKREKMIGLVIKF